MSQVTITPESYNPYWNAPVGNYLVAPAIPDAGELVLNELSSLHDMRQRANVRAYDGTTEMALIDKKFAHAVEEVMWLHAGEAPIATLSDFITNDPNGDKTSNLFTQMASCAEAAEAQNGYVSLSWSSDPDTHHRPSIQGEKRLHFHLTSRNSELDALPEVTTPISDLSFIDNRRLAEKYSFVATAYLTDLLEARPELGIKTSPIHPCVLSIEIGEWADLATPETQKTIATFLDIAENQYGDILGRLGGEDEYGRISPDCPSDPYESIKTASGLDESSVGLALLARYVRELKTLRQRQNTRSPLPGSIDNSLKGQKKHLYTALAPSKGISYAGSFSKHDGVLYFHFRPCKFSDLGGAGCAFLQGMPVRVKKGTVPMSSEQLDSRKRFVDQSTAIVLGSNTLRAEVVSDRRIPA